MDIYSTHFMEMLLREKPQVFTFLRDRYFPEVAIFKTDKVIVDYDDGEGNELAPFVIPEVGKAPMGRSGYETMELAPANIAPSRPLSMNDIKKRRAGESLVSEDTPEMRERKLLVEDLEFLDRAITRREEWMCAQTMLKNECKMEHIGDQADKHVDLTARFYAEGEVNPGVFKPSKKWEVGTAAKRGSWYDDVCLQTASLLDSGREVTDLVVGAEVADMILSDPWIIAMLDNRRLNMGKIDPRWQENGVVNLGIYNFGGVMLEIFTYRGSYQEKNKQGKLVTKSYFPAKGAVLAAPKTGKLRYGAVTQVEMDLQTYTRVGKRIPKHNVNVESNQKETILTSCPIAAPKMKGQWRGCEDVFKA